MVVWVLLGDCGGGWGVLGGGGGEVLMLYVYLVECFFVKLFFIKF